MRWILAPIVAMAVTACGDPEFGRRYDACVSRGAETLAGVTPSPRDAAATRCSQSVDAFGVIP